MALGSATLGAVPDAPVRAGRWAWWICWLMFASTVLCYMDRQAIALVKEPLKLEFHIRSEEAYGWLMASFGMAYALFQVPAGVMADAGDVRKIYAIAVAGWSLAGIAAAFSPTLGVLIACRVLLGIGESFNWPCALRVTSRILPPSDRALGNGIFNSGAAVGAVIGPPTITFLTALFGWRIAFAAVGLLGFVWVGAWLGFHRGIDRDAGPRDGPSAVPSGLPTRARVFFSALLLVATITACGAVRYGQPAIWTSIAVLMLGLLVVARVLPRGDLAAQPWSRGLGVIVRLRRFWVLAVVSVSINVSWHFLVYWMPSFFQEKEKFGQLAELLAYWMPSLFHEEVLRQLASGLIIALPFLAADAGNLIGGGLSGRLARRGMSLIRARTVTIALAATLIALGTSVGVAGNPWLVLALVSIMAFGVATFMANYFALCQDVSHEHTGLVVGVLGGIGNLFATGFLPVAGRIKDVTGGLGASFVIVGLLPIVGVLALALCWGRDRAGLQTS